jgi:hypothetical protein
MKGLYNQNKILEFSVNANVIKVKKQGLVIIQDGAG